MLQVQNVFTRPRGQDHQARTAHRKFMVSEEKREKEGVIVVVLTSGHKRPVRPPGPQKTIPGKGKKKKKM